MKKPPAKPDEPTAATWVAAGRIIPWRALCKNRNTVGNTRYMVGSTRYVEDTPKGAVGNIW